MPLFKKQTAKPKWIRDQEREKKKEWWHMTAPKDGISRGSQYETSFERDNAGVGAIAVFLFGASIFGIIVVLMLILNWIGKNLHS